MIETIAALALVSVALAASFSILYRAPAIRSGIDDAAVRILTAERILETALATPAQEPGSRTIPVDPASVGGRTGWTAEITVERVDTALLSITVAVRDGEGETVLASLRAAEGRS